MKTGFQEFEDVHRATDQADAQENTSSATVPVVERPMEGHPLFARSPAMRDFVELATRAQEDSRLICFVGEPGTGRSVVARELHAKAGGQPESFTLVECAGRDHWSLESSLFGPHTRAGLQTLYLSHLAEVPLETQAKLARFVHEQGSLSNSTGRTKVVASLDVSVVAALEDGKLLPELVHQIVSLDIPALRQRKLDIPLLGEHLLQDAAIARGTPPRVFSRAAASLLSALPWPGNTPELSAVVQLLATSVDRPVVELDDVLAHLRLATHVDRSEAGMTLRQAREQFERDCISAALAKHRGRMADAAQALGIQRTNLYRKIRQLKVPRAGRPTAR